MPTRRRRTLVHLFPLHRVEPAMIRLVQQFGAHTGRQLTFDQDRVRLGRAPTNDVAFDPYVDLDASANHCEIVREAGVYFVVDSGSRNGTYVNGVRVQKQRLQHGDVLECGRGGPRLRIEFPHAAPLAMTPVPTAVSSAPFGGSGMSAPSGGGLYGPPAGAMGLETKPGYSSVPPGAALGGAAGAAWGGATSGRFSDPPPSSLGAAMAAQLPAGAQVGKRTVAMMINQALAQVGAKGNHTGLKIAMGLTIALVLAGLGAVGYFVWRESQRNEERLAQLTTTNSNENISPGERITQRYEAAIYLLAVVGPTGRPRGFCTGFAVTRDLIATNAHCVDAAQQFISMGGSLVALQSNGRGAQVPVQPVFRDPRFRDPNSGIEGSGFDVGLMRSSAPLPVQVRLASLQEAMNLRPGAEVYVYGFPGLTVNETSPVATITQGVVNRSTDFFDRAADPPLAQKVQHSAQTTSGSSGSPIFLANGTVIAINAGSLADDERQRLIDPTGRAVTVQVNRSSNFKYGMRADLIRAAIQAVGETVP